MTIFLLVTGPVKRQVRRPYQTIIIIISPELVDSCVDKTSHRKGLNITPIQEPLRCYAREKYLRKCWEKDT